MSFPVISLAAVAAPPVTTNIAIAATAIAPMRRFMRPPFPAGVVNG